MMKWKRDRHGCYYTEENFYVITKIARGRWELVEGDERLAEYSTAREAKRAAETIFYPPRRYEK